MLLDAIGCYRMLLMLLMLLDAIGCYRVLSDAIDAIGCYWMRAIHGVVALGFVRYHHRSPPEVDHQARVILQLCWEVELH